MRTNTSLMIDLWQREAANLLLNGSEGEYFTHKGSGSLFKIPIK